MTSVKKIFKKAKQVKGVGLGAQGVEMEIEGLNRVARVGFLEKVKYEGRIKEGHS